MKREKEMAELLKVSTESKSQILYAASPEREIRDKDGERECEKRWYSEHATSEELVRSVFPMASAPDHSNCLHNAIGAGPQYLAPQ